MNIHVKYGVDCISYLEVFLHLLHHQRNHTAIYIIYAYMRRLIITANKKKKTHKNEKIKIII